MWRSARKRNVECKECSSRKNSKKVRKLTLSVALSSDRNPRAGSTYLVHCMSGRKLQRTSSGISFPPKFPLKLTVHGRTFVVHERQCVAFLYFLLGLVLFVVVWGRYFFVDLIVMAPRRLVNAGVGAANIAAEPTSRVALPQRVPFGFHGSWIQD